MYVVNFPAQTNKATFNPIIEVKDQDTGELLDLSDIDITIQVRDENDCVLLTATKADKIVLVDIGYFQSTFDPSDFSRFCAGTYHVHCSLYRDDVTRDFILGPLPIVHS